MSRPRQQNEVEAMKKWNLIVDVAECTNCNVCALAVQDEHVGNDFPEYARPMPKHGSRWINIERRERGTQPVTDVVYVPTMCQHCDDAPCIEAAPDAIRKRDDGVVIIDPVKSRGRREIVDACPYGAVWWNEAEQVPQHWYFDAHLLDAGWAEPRCVTSCATNALKSVCVTDAEMQNIATEQKLEPLRNDIDTRPRVHYRNLWRYNTNFVAGTVSAKIDGRIECIEKATVHLIRAELTVATTTTDPFGDFRFDQLPPDGGSYTVRINSHGFEETERSFDLNDCVNLGEIQLVAS